MSDTRTLFLTLKRRWFDEIASGKKKQEFRALKPYWKSRIEGRHYDEIVFRHGYSAGAPMMRVEFKGWSFGKNSAGQPCYVIELGRILSGPQRE